ncbi:hypothetical protein ACGF7W_19650 [Streptomyces sp. NPDC048219]|uniref:hypothetical protein n=1 Tax=Streptomyces sp. NPDC048219 TaxID=3365517 RepID=UPI00371494EE
MHLRHGQVYEGAQFPTGTVLVLEDPEYGLVVIASDTDALLRGYGGGRIEWPEDTRPAHTTDTAVPDWLRHGAHDGSVPETPAADEEAGR